MAHYLVTGAAGFIGATVAEQLLAGGHHVTGIDNLNDAYDVRLKQWRLRCLLPHPRFGFQRLDICDRAKLAEFWQARPPFDAVLNLAARAGVRQSVENPWLYMETNITGTLNLLELSKIHGVRQFILASTSSLYGSHNPMPYAEEADTSRPLSPYAASKKAAETLCYTYHYLHGLDVTVLRYFTVYGPAGRPDMSPFRFVQWISEGRPLVVYGDGRQSRDFTHVADIARGTVASLALRGYSTINLGSDRPAPILDLIRMIERQLKQEARIEFHPPHASDVPATWADITRARRWLGWEPMISLEEGVASLVDWYTKNRDWAREIDTFAGAPAATADRSALHTEPSPAVRQN